LTLPVLRKQVHLINRLVDIEIGFLYTEHTFSRLRNELYVVEYYQEQCLILEFIADAIQEKEYPPTIQEIGEHFGIASTNGVYDHLAALEKKGYIERSSKARSIRLTQKAMAGLVRPNANALPLLGTGGGRRAPAGRGTCGGLHHRVVHNWRSGMPSVYASKGIA
jgi:hypothetical protein